MDGLDGVDGLDGPHKVAGLDGLGAADWTCYPTLDTGPDSNSATTLLARAAWRRGFGSVVTPTMIIVL